MSQKTISVRFCSLAIFCVVVFAGGIPIAKAHAAPLFKAISETRVDDTSVAGSPNTTAFVTGDLNGDGNLDVVVSATDRNKVYVSLGNGDGTFGSATGYAVGTAPKHVTLADVDKDG